MRLDHLLSKESPPDRSIGDSQSITGYSACLHPGGRRSPPALSRAWPSGPVSGPCKCARPHCSVLRERMMFVPSRSRLFAPLWSTPAARQSPSRLAYEKWRRRAPLENSIASTSIFVLQATKSQRWMPWRLKPMKDVGGCDKPRGAAYQASIRGRPNGETRHPSWGVTPV